jgi:ERCC4-related helicase
MIKIKNFEPRIYQENILKTCINKNCLIVLPTGLGKTKTAILISANRLNNFPNSKILFLTPTKPLASQIQKEFIDCLDIDEKQVVLFTGEISPSTRKSLWQNARIIVSTPQGCLNDVVNSTIDLKNVSLLVLDEAHRCVGDYDYVFMCKKYQEKASYPRIVGLTASPGSDLNKISEVCKNAFIEDIEIRTEKDSDVSPYVQDIKIDWIKIDLPDEFLGVINFLQLTLKERLIKLKNYGAISNINPNSLSKKDLLSLQAQTHGRIDKGEKDFLVWQIISLVAESIKVHHAIELLETQGVNSCIEYVKRLFHDAETTKVKAIKSLVKDPNFKSALIKLEELAENGYDHPKLDELIKIIRVKFDKNKDAKVIVFNQYRYSASNIEKQLNKIENVRAKLFVGQLKKADTGLSQKEQHKVIDNFKSGAFNVLVSTSIGEEGLDIPKVDTVIFYEPVPSAIRAIQRRGRTARQQEGELIILITKNTRDETYHWVAHNKEKRMHRVLDSIKNKLKFTSEKMDQQTINNFIKTKDELKIIADFREKGSNLIKELLNLGIDVTMQNLLSGDYILSDRVGIEFKTKEDFINSIIDGRLLTQVKDLRNNYQNPLLLVCGEKDIYSIRNIHPNAIRGMFASIALNYNVPILFANNFQDAAALIKVIATREQKDNDRDVLLRSDKKPLTNSEFQSYIIQSLPGVGPTLAKSLLREFKTVKKIINLSEEELQKVEKLGPKKAKEIKRILEEEYKEED